MAKFLVIFCLLASLSYIQAASYDYHLFASFWSATNCYFRKCYSNQTGDLNPNFFNVHGLWPNYWKGYPAYCGNIPDYNPDYLPKLLLDKMRTDWNGMNWTTDDFHDHEWTKHGTCWDDPLGNVSDSRKQLDFFTTSMSVAYRLDLAGSLRRGGVVPSKEPYELKAFTKIFDRALGAGTYLLECEQDHNGKEYIFSIYVCLDLNYKTFECPDNLAPYFNDICPEGPIYYPPVDSISTLDENIAY